MYSRMVVYPGWYRRDVHRVVYLSLHTQGVICPPTIPRVYYAHHHPPGVLCATCSHTQGVLCAHAPIPRVYIGHLSHTRVYTGHLSHTRVCTREACPPTHGVYKGGMPTYPRCVQRCPSGYIRVCTKVSLRLYLGGVYKEVYTLRRI